MREKYLPIGTVVTLKGATKEIMVIGLVLFQKAFCLQIKH